jgi:hypothetical protein
MINKKHMNPKFTFFELSTRIAKVLDKILSGGAARI